MRNRQALLKPAAAVVGVLGVLLMAVVLVAVWGGLASPAAAADCTELPGARLGQCGEAPRQTPDGGQPGSSSTTSTSAPAGRAGRDDAAARELAALVNAERNRAGLRSLAVHVEVDRIAWEHSAVMADQGRIWHNDAYFTSENRHRLGASALGENVALNRDADDAHARLMASSGHRANILDARFTHLGIAAVRDRQGVLYITQDFAQIVSRPAPTPAVPPVPVAPGPPAAPASPLVETSPATSRDASPPTVLRALLADPGPSAEVDGVARSSLSLGPVGTPPALPAEPDAGVAGAVMAIAAVGLCDKAGRRAAPSLFKR